MFDELKEVNYFATDSYSLIILKQRRISNTNEHQRRSFSVSVFNRYYFRNKSFIIDVRLAYI